MAAIAKSLSPESSTAVAQFVSEMEKLPPKKGHDHDTERGQELYAERCALCHRFNTSGEQVFRSPPLNAFPDWYIKFQFEKFVTGQRGAVPNDADGEKMRIVAATKMPEAELDEIIAFIQDAAIADP